MPVARISKGTFELARLDDAERVLAESEAALRGPLQELNGLLRYYVGIDRERARLPHERQHLGDGPGRPPDGHAPTDARAAPDSRGGRGDVRADHEPRDAVDDHAVTNAGGWNPPGL